MELEDTRVDMNDLISATEGRRGQEDCGRQGGGPVVEKEWSGWGWWAPPHQRFCVAVGAERVEGRGVVPPGWCDDEDESSSAGLEGQRTVKE